MSGPSTIGTAGGTAAPACVMIVAGEASGDLHGARLVAAMGRRLPGAFFCGIGGPALRRAGVRIMMEAAELSVVGITEVFARLPRIWEGMGRAAGALRALRPDLLVLIDFPDFNLHLAARAKRLGIPVLYYVSPQIWAWRSGRVRKIARRVDHMAVILPFEADFYRRHGVPVTFVGHPLLDAPLPAWAGAVPAAEARETIGLLPGSRRGEVARLLPVMRAAALRLRAERPGLRFLISQAPAVDIGWIAAALGEGGAEGFEIVPGGAEAVMRRSALVVAASGTVTLEAGIHGVPMVIVYRVSALSYRLGKALVRVPSIGLVNLVAGRRLVPELLQGEAGPERIAAEVSRLLANGEALAALRRELLALRGLLGGPGAAERVAAIALELMGRPPEPARLPSPAEDAPGAAR
jgi:lipid-A-disaccharide synthase